MTSHDLNGVRISTSIFNTREDVDLLVAALRELNAEASAETTGD